MLFSVKNTSFEGLQRAGVRSWAIRTKSGSGAATSRTRSGTRTIDRTDALPDWEGAQHLTCSLTAERGGGVAEAARPVLGMGAERADKARSLAYRQKNAAFFRKCRDKARALVCRLYSLVERKRWMDETHACNIVVTAWPYIQVESAQLAASVPEQAGFGFSEGGIVLTDTVRLVKEFGFYPHPLQIKAGPVTIVPLPDLKQIASDVLASDGIEKDWIYAPLQQVRNLMNDQVRECPYTTRVFGLLKTHSIEHVAATSEDHIEFHIWALSFFVGMRLTATEAGFLDATPLKPHRLVDFILHSSSLARAVQLAEDFWMTNHHKPCRAKCFVAAVHALFLSQYPQSLQFEQFVLLYMAVDACFKLTRSLHKSSKHINHANRIAWMCDQFGVERPGWADPENPDGSEVAGIRNDTLHEALFMGAPLGFAVHGVSTNQSHTLEQNLPLEMRALVCRLLVALIGGNDAAYIRSPVDDRQRHGLDLN